jgi:hypothetical protein
MHGYTVELIHEPSGAVMNMTVFTDEKVDEVELARDIWAEMSVVVLQYFEEDEND